MARLKITLTKTYDIDTSKDWDDDQPLIDQIEKAGGDPRSPTSSELADAVTECIADDGLEAIVGDLDLSELNCEVQVLEGAGETLKGEIADDGEDA